MSTRIARLNEEAFWSRYERDQAVSMTPEQWHDWVNALPRPEFMVMVSLRSTARVSNGQGDAA